MQNIGLLVIIYRWHSSWEPGINFPHLNMEAHGWPRAPCLTTTHFSPWFYRVSSVPLIAKPVWLNALCCQKPRHFNLRIDFSCFAHFKGTEGAFWWRLLALFNLQLVEMKSLAGALFFGRLKPLFRSIGRSVRWCWTFLTGQASCLPPWSRRYKSPFCQASTLIEPILDAGLCLWPVVCSKEKSCLVFEALSFRILRLMLSVILLIVFRERPRNRSRRTCLLLLSRPLLAKIDDGRRSRHMGRHDDFPKERCPSLCASDYMRDLNFQEAREKSVECGGWWKELLFIF